MGWWDENDCETVRLEIGKRTIIFHQCVYHFSEHCTKRMYEVRFEPRLSQSVVWMAWNSYPICGQMWVKKLSKTRSIHVVKLDFMASNDCSLINWRSWCEKMFNTTQLCENCFDTRNSYPNRVRVRWSFPTPLIPILIVGFSIFNYFPMRLSPVSWPLVGCLLMITYVVTF